MPVPAVLITRAPVRGIAGQRFIAGKQIAYIF
jgi:hypothetical protein